MKIVICFLAAIFMCAAPGVAQSGAQPREPQSVYVADFVSRSISDRSLLASFTDLFETAFSAMTAMKTKYRNKLNVSDDLRYDYVK